MKQRAGEALPQRDGVRKCGPRVPRAPAHPVAKRLAGWVFEERGRSRRTATMKWNEKVRLALGAALLAAALFALLAVPGLVSDRDSTVPLHRVREARQ